MAGRVDCQSTVARSAGFSEVTPWAVDQRSTLPTTHSHKQKGRGLHHGLSFIR